VQLAFPKAVEGVGSFADVTPALLDETKTALGATSLQVAVLGAYVELSYADEAARQHEARTFRDTLPWAATLRVGCVGSETTPMKKQPGATRAEALRALRRSLEEILPEAERLHVTVAVEPVHYHALGSPELARELLREMKSPVLKLIFDPVNLLRPEDIDAQDALWARCVDQMGEDVVAIHLKGASWEANSNGVLRETPLQSSVVDYPALVSRLRSVNAPVLRENAVPDMAAREIAFIRGLWQ
jgi:sugar phosphate isomerase/epimerase